MILIVGPDEADAVAGRVAGLGAGGVVARPGLFGRLGGPARVTVVSAPPGSGKTVLLRSWIDEAGLAGRAAWVSAGRDEWDPQRFWLSVVGALRRTAAGAALVQALTAAPDMDGWVITERLLSDLAPLRDRLWLVIDDVHELGEESLRQLELLLLRAPPELRFVLSARHDVRLGLHRLRLEGELAEIRAGDLRFSVPEAAELFAAAGVGLPDSAVAKLHERTEGWAAGLRLAALSLVGHPDPEGFAAEFSGTERTVAEYLLAEVLDRQSEPTRRLLLRTSVLGRVNGELADLLTGDEGGERLLQDLERAGAFTVSLDAARSWFRYHQMFAGLLALELRRAAPGEVAGLHRAAAGWFAGHGYPVEAVRHAQAAQDWGLAAGLLADHWPGLHLDGQAAIAHELLAGFPAGARAANAVLVALVAADELNEGALVAADLHLGLAERGLESVPESRRDHVRLLLGIARLQLDRQRGNLPGVAEGARRLEAMAETADTARRGLGQDLRALALISLGTAEYWTGRHEESLRHLESGVALARRIGRPYLELTGLAYQAGLAATETLLARAAEHARQAFELAQRHGWADEPAASIPCGVLAAVLVWQWRPEEAEAWVRRAERTLKAEAEPAVGTRIYHVRGMLELERGRGAEAVAAFSAAVQLSGSLTASHFLVPLTQAWLLQALVRVGETERAEQVLAGLSDTVRDRGEIRIATAALRLAQADPHAATVALAPVLDGSSPRHFRIWMILAFLLEAIARDALGDSDAARNALERALDLAEPDGVLAHFLLYPAPGLLQSQTRHRTAHAGLTADILSLLAGNEPAARRAPSRPLVEPLTESELRVLRYLPTNLTAPEIASQLYVSLNTVKTHIRSVYAKLGAHGRAEVVTRARDLGLLAPSARTAR